MSEQANTERPTLTDRLRVVFRVVVEPVAAFFNRLGLRPNTMTLAGLGGNIIGAYFLTQGQFVVGGIILFLMGSFDALDGTMARLRGEASDWGAFVDSVTDRYSELITFAALLYYFMQEGNTAGVMWVYAAAGGSVLVSYVRARAQSLGLDVKIGLFSRFERYLVLLPSLIFNIPLVGMIVIGLGANLTALQRIYAFRKKAKKL